jgi:hypothetical protein
VNCFSFLNTTQRFLFIYQPPSRSSFSSVAQPKVVYAAASLPCGLLGLPVGSNEAGLLLLAPALGALAVCANRLLKPKHPSLKNRTAFRELLKKHCFQTAHAGAAKPTALQAEVLSPGLLQQLAAQLWCSGLRVSAGQPSAWSWLLHGLVFLRDWLHSQPEAWLMEELACLLASQQTAHHETNPKVGLSAERFLPLSKTENLLRLAEALKGLPEAKQNKTLALKGKACLHSSQVLLHGWMQTPLPWEGLFLQTGQTQPPHALQDTPYLQEWQGLYTHLLTKWPEAEAFLQAFNTSASESGEVKGVSFNWLFEAFSFLLESPERWPLSQPINALMLVEGASEECLLPAYASALAFSFKAEGLRLKSVGGKNHMLASYLQVRAWANAPLLLLLDKDASPLVPALEQQLQEGDDIVCCLTYGELEDGYAWPHVLLLLKTHYGSICKAESSPQSASREKTMPHSNPKSLDQKVEAWLALQENKSMLRKQGCRFEQLRKLWLYLGLNPLDKTTLAKLLSDLPISPEWVDPQLQGIIEQAITLARQHRQQALTNLKALQACHLEAWQR